jgi:predicted nucleic acid-binding protein
MLTIDASVWVNADSPSEVNHESSRNLLDRAAASNFNIVVPTLLLPEVAGAISRTRGDPQLASDFALALSALPFITWISLDDRLARVAFALAAQHALRGADAVYAAVAREHNCDLISLDDQHLTRLTGVVPTFTPAQALTRLAR